MIEQVTRGLLNKVLHEPTVRLKDAAGSALGDGYADALAALFALRDDGPPTATDPATELVTDPPTDPATGPPTDPPTDPGS